MSRVVALSPLSRVNVGHFITLCALVFLQPAWCLGQGKTADEPSAKDVRPVGDAAVEVRFTDNSVLKLSLREDRIEFLTQYGRLYIPVADIKRIEFGLRVPDDVAKKVDSALADLGNSQFRRRETASAILLGLREKAYPAVLKATHNSDMEIANRAVIMRRGRKVGEMVPTPETYKEIVSLIVGGGG